MRPARTAALLVVIGVLASCLACSKEPYEGEPKPNQPPRVWLSAAPPEGTDSEYQVHMYWGAWDPDGEVDHYEYLITDNETGVFDAADTVETAPPGTPPCDESNRWRCVWSNDSTFIFTADKLADSTTTRLVTRFERSHTFFIRAVDNKGAVSPTPAYRSFTAWTLSPSVSIQIPKRIGFNPAAVPPITTFRWNAADFTNNTLTSLEPDSIRHMLLPVVGGNWDAGLGYIRKRPNAPEWSEWRYYKAPLDSGKFWTTPVTDYGNYLFAVQAKDEAGAVTPIFDEDFNVRRVLVTQLRTGPLLKVTNEFVGTLRSTVSTTPVTIVDIPAGVSMGFEWQANADSYGGTVSGYRYGWDIIDFEDPDQWDVDYTPFTSTKANSVPRTFSFGTHTFTVEVKDNSSGVSRIQVKINIVRFTMEHDLLLVDDFAESPENPALAGWSQTNGGLPSDAEQDQFWARVLGRVATWNPVNDQIEVRAGQDVVITKFANYKNIIWNAYGGASVLENKRPKLYSLVKFLSKDPDRNPPAGKVQPNLLALFVRAGGHLILCGRQPLTQVINTFFFNSAITFPFLYKYELEGQQDGKYTNQIQSGNYVGDRSFAYRDACVRVLDVCDAPTAQFRTQLKNGCSVDRIRVANTANNCMRTAIPHIPDVPQLFLRSEAAGPGKLYAPSSRGLEVEVYNPPYFNFCPYTESSNCSETIYGLGTLDTGSALYDAPVALWSTSFADRVNYDAPGAIAARSAYLGFAPVYFEPDSVRVLFEHMLGDEWNLEITP